MGLIQMMLLHVVLLCSLAIATKATHQTTKVLSQALENAERELRKEVSKGFSLRSYCRPNYCPNTDDRYRVNECSISSDKNEVPQGQGPSTVDEMVDFVNTELNKVRHLHLTSERKGKNVRISADKHAVVFRFKNVDQSEALRAYVDAWLLQLTKSP